MSQYTAAVAAQVWLTVQEAQLLVFAFVVKIACRRAQTLSWLLTIMISRSSLRSTMCSFPPAILHAASGLVCLASLPLKSSPAVLNLLL